MEKQSNNIAKEVECNGVKKELAVEKSQKNKKGLSSLRAIIFLLLWYFFSGCTLFLNKYILTYQNGNPTVLGACQMLMTATCGFIQLYFPCGMYKLSQRLSKPPGFYRHMILVGEQTGLYVNLSLLPVMSGLALCSVNEVSFELVGFMAAMATNVTECVQNVYSKMLISGDKFKYTPAELQFYTSVASIIVQIPATLLLVDITSSEKLGYRMIFCFVLNGIFFHFQSITAYVLMDYISPVTHSVANTAKRAFLIWLSIVMFGNPVTVLSGLGTITVIAGVFLYIKAQEYDNDRISSANLMHRKVRAI
ncbi:hypothetical protein NQ318_019627 [Aromia moschata]|uniref:Sugar phosphate transporter domain-containing protein n=1 Tax=Aromia moschata TaxID=1265417 RepID=A0AAV8Z619_9CUCU|nr:hypothetical protein NQ318_019627 [Aromia moschata]